MKNLHRTSTYLNPGISFFLIVTLNNLDSSRCMRQEGKHLERSQKSVTVTLMLLSPSHRDLQGAHLPLFCPRAQQGHSRDTAASMVTTEKPQRHHSYPLLHTKPNIQPSGRLGNFSCNAIFYPPYIKLSFHMNYSTNIIFRGKNKRYIELVQTVINMDLFWF